MMNRIVKRARSILAYLVRGQSGYATLTAVLILLISGALIITPLLAYMDIGLEAGQTHERRTDELYAADAGVDYALWNIKMGQVPQGGPLELPQFALNDRAVNVTIEDVTPPGGDMASYKITSVATSDSSSSTTVESYVSVVYSTIGFLEGAITSYDDAEIKSTVVGDVVCGGDLYIKAKVDGSVLCSGTVTNTPQGWVTGNVTYGQGLVNQGRIDGTITYEPGLEIPVMDNWPSADVFSSFYLNQVDKNNPFIPSSIDVASTPSIGPLYKDGNLDIQSSQNGKTLTLNGIIYVTGQLNIGGAKDFTLDLNGQSIFCAYNGTGNAIYISDKCTVKGPGCIIAVGDIFFAPKMTLGEENPYVIVMSIEGWTDMHPQGDFCGSVVGKVDVELYGAGGTLTWAQPDYGDLKFPNYNTAEISTYNIYNYDRTASP